jgi:hypothetical protein
MVTGRPRSFIPAHASPTSYRSAPNPMPRNSSRVLQRASAEGLLDRARRRPGRYSLSRCEISHSTGSVGVPGRCRRRPEDRLLGPVQNRVSPDQASSATDTPQWHEPRERCVPPDPARGAMDWPSPAGITGGTPTSVTRQGWQRPLIHPNEGPLRVAAVGVPSPSERHARALPRAPPNKARSCGLGSWRGARIRRAHVGTLRRIRALTLPRSGLCPQFPDRRRSSRSRTGNSGANHG